jgi:hypothetical protein
MHIKIQLTLFLSGEYMSITIYETLCKEYGVDRVNRWAEGRNDGGGDADADVETSYQQLATFSKAAYSDTGVKWRDAPRVQSS